MKHKILSIILLLFIGTCAYAATSAQPTDPNRNSETRAKSPEMILFGILSKEYQKDFYQQYRRQGYGHEEAARKAYEEARKKASVDCHKKEMMSKYAAKLIGYSPEDANVENIKKNFDMNKQANADLEMNVKQSQRGARIANDWDAQQLAHQADNASLEQMYQALGLSGGETYLNELARTATPQQIENLGKKLHTRINNIDRHIKSVKTKLTNYCNEMRLPDATDYRSYNEYVASLGPNIELRDEMKTELSNQFNSIASADKDRDKAVNALEKLGNKFKNCSNCKAK